jgi:PIN domain nuclease of toxin-antitoxin system
LRLLFDSHALLWALSRPAALAAPARRVLEAMENDVVASVVSLWELEIKASVGKLDLPDDLTVVLPAMATSLLQIEMAHLRRLRTLPFHHRDPFDRLLIAQALEEGLTIVTRDRAFRAYGVPLIAA